MDEGLVLSTAPGSETPVRAVPDTSVNIADGIQRSLDPRAIPMGRVVGRIVTAAVSLVLAVAGSIVWVAANPASWVVALMAIVWALITGLLAWWLHKWPALSHEYASFTVNAEGIEIRRGVLWRTVISVPRSRVQHTDVSQGPLERRYGLGTLDIYTAGTDHAKVDLHGLDHENALEIRNHLLPLEAPDAV